MDKKYIVTLADEYALVHKLTVPITINGKHTAWMQTDINLTPYTEPDTEAIRMEAYQQGLNDAWECARKVTQVRKYGGYGDCLEEVFGRHRVPWDVFDYSASEAIEKIRQYEQEKEEQIQVGDEVIPRETEYDTMIVTRLWKDDYDSDCIDAIGFDGRISSFLVSRVSKTGKHCEIAEVLQKMKES